jgi:pimeloyl-ACP methyl ester carboxylesterase
MPKADVEVSIDGGTVEKLSLAYEVIGDSGRPWVITPGGRFSREYPGVRELAVALADLGNTVLVHDRPNCGESDVCFAGATESAMQADALAALLSHLDMAPAVIVGGSGGARVSLLTAVRHRRVTSGLAAWMMSGGVFGLMSIGITYCASSIRAVWNGGMEAVVDLPETERGNWHDVIRRNPANRRKLLDQDPDEFKETMLRWLGAYSVCGDQLIPGVADAEVRAMDRPAIVFRSGTSDPFHTRETSEQLASALPNAELVEPPWQDTEWIDSKIGHRFDNWPRLAPLLHDWAGKALA